jgi:DNA-directed RNA polymerase specialized sigma24 family protein
MRPAWHIEEVQRLFLRHMGLLRGFVLGLVPDFDHAEDVFQEVFLTITHKVCAAVEKRGGWRGR